MANIRFVIESDASGAIKNIRQVADEFDKAAKKGKEAQESTKGWTSVLQGIGQGFGQDLFSKLNSAITSIPAVMTSAVESMLSMSDQMSNLSAATGIGVEALQKFKFAGSAVGVSVEEIAKGMQKFQKGLVEGSTASLAAIKQLGLSRETLANMLPEDQLTTVLTALNDKIPNAANRTQIAMTLLGKAGAALLPLGASLKETMAQAEALGIVMSKSDVAAADALGDKIGFLSQTFGGLLNNIGATITSNQSLSTLIEGLTGIVGDLSKAVHNNQAALQDLVSSGVELVTNGLLLMVDAVGLAGEAWNALRVTWLSALNVGGELAKVQLQLRLGMAEQAKKSTYDPNIPGSGQGRNDPGLDARITDLKNQIAMVDAWKGELSDAANGINESTGKWTEGVAKVRGALEALQTKVVGVHGAQVKLNGTTQTSAVVLQAAAEATAVAKQEAAEAAKSYELMADEIEKAKKAAEQWASTQSVAESAKSYELMADEIEKAKKAAQDWADNQSATEAAKSYELMTEKAHAATVDWSKSLADVANLFQVIGLNADSALGRIIGGVPALASAFQSLSKLGGDKGFANAFSTGKGGGMSTLSGKMAVGSAVAGGISTVGSAVFGDKMRLDSASAGGRAMAGAAMGAQLGAIAGPWGMAAGAVVGAIIGALRKPSWVAVGKEAGKTLGFAVSEELAKAIEATSKKLKISTKSATLLNLDKGIAESGKAASTFAPQINDLIKGIADKSIPAKEGMEQLSKSFGMLAEEASKSKFASVALFSVMKQARESKVMTDEMKASISAAIDAMGEAVKKTGGLQILSDKDAVNQATIFGFVWGQTVAEKGLAEAGRILGPGFEALQKKLEESGFGDAAAAVFAPIAQQFALATDEAFAGAADAAQGFSDILKNSINTAMPMTIDQFSAFQGAATSAYAQAEAAGVKAGLSVKAAQQEALLSIGPLLAQLVQGAAAYGFNLDEGTQALIEQAKASGVAFAATPIDRMADSLDRAVVALEKMAGITRDVADGFGSISRSAGGLPSNLPDYSSTGNPYYGGKPMPGERGMSTTGQAPININVTYSPQQTVNGAGNQAETLRFVQEGMRNNALGLEDRLRQLAREVVRDSGANQ